jgi:transposase
MLDVEAYEEIRRKVEIEGLSKREAARTLGHSRKTVDKALKHKIPPGYELSQPRACPTLDPVKHIIDAWIEENKTIRPKQRMKAKKIWIRLRNEYSFKGHYGTVQRYVKRVSKRQKEVFMPLEFGPGQEAQVDWHEAWIIDNGVERKVQIFAMKLCFSKAPFVYPYEHADLESFLDGHVRAFEYFGGIPRRLAYDNLKCAVIKVGRGKHRELNRRFTYLKAWYLFETRFCNIAKGNEKGDVENLCKHSEQMYLSPPPHVDGLDDLRRKLLEDCRQDLANPGPANYADKTIGQLLQEEQQHMLALPSERFEACIRRSTIIDHYSLVRVDTFRYSAPVRWAHHPCVVKIFADQIQIYCEHQLVAQHRRHFHGKKFVLEPTHYLALLERKPGSLDNAMPFKGWPLGLEFEVLRKELEYRYPEDGTLRYIKVLLLFADHPQQEVKQAVQMCVCRRVFSDDAVLTILRNAHLPTHRQLDLSGKPELRLESNGIRQAALYDQLKTSQEVA